MPTSRATDRRVTASAEPIRAINASAASTISWASREPSPRALRRLVAPVEGPFPSICRSATSVTLHLLAKGVMVTSVSQHLYSLNRETQHEPSGHSYRIHGNRINGSRIKGSRIHGNRINGSRIKGGRIKGNRSQE